MVIDVHPHHRAWELHMALDRPVLGEILGLDANAVGALAAAGRIASRPLGL